MVYAYPETKHKTIKKTVKEFLTDRDFKGAETYLLGLLERPLDDEVRGSVISNLCMVLVTLNRREDALAWAKRRAEEAPDDPLSWLGLGQQYRYRSAQGPTTEDLVEALAAYRKGADLARAQNIYVRFLQGDVCRTLARLEDFPALEEAMRAYLAALENRPETDIPQIETDWLGYTPEGAIDEKLRKTFHDLAEAEGRWRASMSGNETVERLPTLKDLAPFILPPP